MKLGAIGRTTGAVIVLTAFLGVTAFGEKLPEIPSREDSSSRKKVALVVGNSAYRHTTPLANPRNDAEDMGRLLKAAGFDVITLVDADRRSMAEALDHFSEKSRGAELAFFYFAGHGIENQGRNYLIPLDARLKTRADLEYEAIRADQILARMEETRVRFIVVILDACRNNPLSRSFRSGGLAPMDAPGGTIIAYATGPGKVAEDGAGRNGLYTKHLLRNLSRRDLTIQQALNATGLAVMEETAKAQTPWISSTPVPPISLWDRDQAKTAPMTWKEPLTGMEFVWVPAGCFPMGSSVDQATHDPDEEPLHEVCLDSFWMATREVTVGQFRRFVRETGYKTDAERDGYSKIWTGKAWKKKEKISWRNPGFEQDDSHPVTQVSWNDAHAFAQWLSRKGSGRFRLPTEAQWEYACRGGARTDYFWGNDPEKACRYANVADEEAGKAFGKARIHPCADGFAAVAPAGRFAPNPWGLHDILGNLWEWCRDSYDPRAYLSHERENPVHEVGGHLRVLRGGSWLSGPRLGRCAARLAGGPHVRDATTGIRLVKDP